MRAVEGVRRPVSLLLVLGCLGGSLILSVAIKAPCASGDWGGEAKNEEKVVDAEFEEVKDKK